MKLSASESATLSQVNEAYKTAQTFKRTRPTGARLGQAKWSKTSVGFLGGRVCNVEVDLGERGLPPVLLVLCTTGYG